MMKNNWTAKFLLSILITYILLVSSSLTVYANSQQKNSLRSTVISLVPLPDVDLDERFEIIGSIQDFLR